ncbi:hypothetical protein ZYGR_0N01690 [Zygosaccharomyces rouxii]|uniref:DNA polymerase gamma n=1 Tax=Zygosaccharomyces rouxii TaxID=4956 RepID=A0A1Q2ZZA2_ZYGRO|nr:hypothetical protein ZYGR_0N01690 [Zygosaccharomyces rouxii]
MSSRVRISYLYHTSASSMSLRCCRLYRHRSYSTTTKPAAVPEEPTINPVGIQYLSRNLHKQLFTGKVLSHNEDPITPEERVGLIDLSRRFLKTYHLLGKKTSISEPLSMELPKLQGDSLDEHFQRLGHFASEPYKSMCQAKFTKIVGRPKKWIRKQGWMRYEPGKEPEPVPWPLEDTLVFDVETLYKISQYPTLAVALSDKAWYLWCSPFICGSDSFEHLIPLNTQERTGLVIGHNVGYDRARVLEEYNLKPSKTFFLDTQSLHVASSGLCSRQRPKFLKTHNVKRRSAAEDEDEIEADQLSSALANTDGMDPELEEDPWLRVSAMNSLKDVALLHCGIRIDKDPRDRFATTDKNEVIQDFQNLVEYCATDVDTTSQVFDKVWPLFLQKCPHPVSFGALRSLSSCILPTQYNEWADYLNRSERIYLKSKQSIEDKITEIVEDTVKLRDEMSAEEIHKDPWLRQLDWTTKPLKLTKKGVPVKNQKLPGYPEWYRSLFPNKTETRPQVTIKSRNIPIFFKLSWEGYPTIWTSCGWCFATPADLMDKFKAKNYRVADEDIIETYRSETNGMCPGAADNQVLFRIPHPNGPQSACTTLLSKPYIHYFEKGILTSGSDFAREALHMNSSGSYWMAARERIMNQFNVPSSRFPNQFNRLDGSPQTSNRDDLGIILPGIVPMGTVTRRAVENTWLTASNAKENRIGSELKTQVKAPKGYSFVGADVDSEELWIASLVSDSVFNIHGGTAIGWMCLEGTKNEGTDLHTKTAQILGCNRNEAKIFNYGRIYGAGVKFATQLLKKFNPSLPDEEAQGIANQLYENTKGKIQRSKIFKKFWFGGSESILFNKLESIAEQDEPRTPVLGCGITFSLMKRNLRTNTFLPSRINWTIQSSGVDYLHLLCCSMNYLIATYHIKARLCISIHDEIRFLVADEDKYRASMALQVSNIWTRAIFCEQLGINDLPQNCAFFSAVDIDKLLRKEVDMDCITPSNPNPIPHGESIDMKTLLEKPGAMLTNPDPAVNVSHFPASYREPVFSKYNKAHNKQYRKYLLKMQLQNAKWKVDDLEKAYLQETQEFVLKRKTDTTYSLLDYLKDIRQDKNKKKSIMDTTMFGTEDEMFTLEQQVAAAFEESQAVRGRQQKNSKTSNKRKALYRGNKAFEAFYSSVDKPPEQVHSLSQSLEVPVDDVVQDLISNTSRTPKRARKSVKRTTSTKRTSPNKEKKTNGEHEKTSININDRSERFTQHKLH